ncbi:F-box protein at4g22280, partial [Phtheirospermum japonicum]
NGDVFLPNLKNLCLYYIDYDVNEALPHLLSGCPVLEELTIDRTSYRELGCLDISSPTIKRLTVNFPFHSYEFDKVDYSVKINAPALEYLKIDDCSYKHLSISPMTTSLIELDICLNTYLMHESYSYIHAMAKFLEEHACVYSLRTIRINQFGGTEHEFGMVECLLKNHGSLKRMEIYSQSYGIGSKAKCDALQRISQFHRGSKECELAIY